MRRMREVAVIAYAQTPMTRDAGAQNEVELIMQVVHQALDEVKLNQTDIDFTCSGSCDYLQGVTFAFVDGLNAVSSVPPINESHVEMDAAWALYESWLKIQMEEADVALVYGFGKSSPERKIPNIQFHFFPSFVINHGLVNPSSHGYQLHASPNHPKSRGYVTCLLYTSPSPRDRG